MRTGALCAVLGLTLLAGTCWGQVLVPRVAPEAKDLPPLECRTQAVSVDLNNQIARVRVEQVFVNNTGEDLECVYFLPLQESATISRFSYWVKGKEIVGEIREKEEARQVYEQIVARKRDPALLEYAGRNLFRANLFPVSSKEPMRVVVEYSQVCDYDSGIVNFRYPLTAGGSEQKVGQFAITVNLRDQKPLKRVWCPSYPEASIALVAATEAHSASVSFEKSRFTPKTDFELRYELASSDFGVSFLTYREPAKDGYFMLMVAPQEQTTEADIVKKDIVFVFDKSGSMAGEKIQQARDALKFCLRNLGRNDRFGVVTFSDTIESASDKLLPATEANLNAVIKQIGALGADGATDINAALLKALGMFEPNTNQKTVIFLTDGLPTSGEQEVGKIVGNVKAANHRDARLFTFGVGDDVDDYLLLKLATDNHGAEQHVRAGESIEAAVSSFYSKVAKPVLVDLKLAFGSIKTRQVYPDQLPDIFKGKQLIVVGRYLNSGHQDLALSGQINGKPRRFVYPADFPEESTENGFIPRLWAKARVDWAVDSMRLKGENKELKDEVIALSKQYLFVTPYTSFLALPKEEAERLAAATPAAAPVGADPLIRVLAPPDTKRVLAIFPWGRTMPLVYDIATGYWKCRFVTPSFVPHGRYDVTLVLTRGDGTQQRLVISFEADRETPGGSGSSRVTRLRDGWQVRLSLQATDDTSRALAMLPSGDRLELSQNPDTGRWETTFRLTGTAGDSVRVPVVLFDRGHNRLTLEVEVELR